MCRASARDTSQVMDLVSYYGRVVDIILLDYNLFYGGNSVRIEELI